MIASPVPSHYRLRASHLTILPSYCVPYAHLITAVPHMHFLSPASHIRFLSPPRLLYASYHHYLSLRLMYASYHSCLAYALDIHPLSTRIYHLIIIFMHRSDVHFAGRLFFCGHLFLVFSLFSGSRSLSSRRNYRVILTFTCIGPTFILLILLFFLWSLISGAVSVLCSWISHLRSRTSTSDAGSVLLVLPPLALWKTSPVRVLFGD